jgi:hypothetical protein
MTALNLIYLRGRFLGTSNSRSGSSVMVVFLKTVKDLVTIGCAPRPPPAPPRSVRRAHAAQGTTVRRTERGPQRSRDVRVAFRWAQQRGEAVRPAAREAAVGCQQP